MCTFLVFNASEFPFYFFFKAFAINLDVYLFDMAMHTYIMCIYFESRRLWKKFNFKWVTFQANKCGMYHLTFYETQAILLSIDL